jgi:hypothetical protein
MFYVSTNEGLLVGKQKCRWPSTAAFVNRKKATTGVQHLLASTERLVGKLRTSSVRL